MAGRRPRVRFLSTRRVHRHRFRDRRMAVRATGATPRDLARRGELDRLLVPDRGDRRSSRRVRDRPRVRFRLTARVALRVEGRDLAPRRHRGSHDRERGQHPTLRPPVLPGRRRADGAPRPRDRDRPDRRPHHRRPPRKADVLDPRVDVPRWPVGAPVHLQRDELPSPTPREPDRDHQAGQRRAPLGARDDRHGCRRASDGDVRHVDRLGVVRVPLVVHPRAPA